jgi:hypothetical protein
VRSTIRIRPYRVVIALAFWSATLYIVRVSEIT